MAQQAKPKSTNVGKGRIAIATIGFLCVASIATASWQAHQAGSSAPSDPETKAGRFATLVAPPSPEAFAIAAQAEKPSPEPAELWLASQSNNSADSSDCVSRLKQFLEPVHLNFDLSSIRISKSDIDMLARIGEEIANCPSAYVVVAGHADSSGDDATNEAVSWDRADHTVSQLINLGVNPSSIEALGYGATRPLSQGSSEEDAADRRVEFYISRR